MKKSILSTSIAAAVFGLGATGAHAATSLATVDNGIGHMLLVPYFSTQEANSTLLTITNTDTSNGKAVKVRFRGAANSDDLFDFQVFLSPGDVWSANVSKGADGKSVLTTADNSCTKPAKADLNAAKFSTARLDQAMSAELQANGTREGYIEIINMADIPKKGDTVYSAYDYAAGTATLATGASAGATGIPMTGTATATATAVNPLYTAVKHVSSVAPCSGTAWDGLNAASIANMATGAKVYGLTAPTGTLMANWTIINTTNAASWSGQATALKTTASTNVVYSPQTSDALTPAFLADYTADPLLIPGTATSVLNLTNLGLVASTAAAAIVAGAKYDLPDLSTAYDAAHSATNARAQAFGITTNLALNKDTLLAEYYTDSAVSASTDMVFATPTRRYALAMAYAKVSATDDGRRWSGVPADTSTVFSATTTTIATVNGQKLICWKGTKAVPYDREENTPTSTATVVVSPATPDSSQLYCGEASVLSINNGVGTSGALKASVAVTSIDVGYNAGWLTLDKTGLPAVGGAFTKASSSATQSYGSYQAYRFR